MESFSNNTKASHFTWPRLSDARSLRYFTTHYMMKMITPRQRDVMHDAFNGHRGYTEAMKIADTLKLTEASEIIDIFYGSSWMQVINNPNQEIKDRAKQRVENALHALKQFKKCPRCYKVFNSCHCE